jgi:hypothetical protein
MDWTMTWHTYTGFWKLVYVLDLLKEDFNIDQIFLLGLFDLRFPAKTSHIRCSSSCSVCGVIYCPSTVQQLTSVCSNKLDLQTDTKSFNHLYPIMTTSSDANCTRPATLDTTFITVMISELGWTSGIFVLTHDTRLSPMKPTRSSSSHPQTDWSPLLVTKSKILKRRWRYSDKDSHWGGLSGRTLSSRSVVHSWDHSLATLHKVTKEGVVSTRGETGFTDGQGVDTHFKYPLSVVVVSSDEFILSWNVGVWR